VSPPRDESLLFRQKEPKPCLPVRGPPGPSASAPNKMARELAPRCKATFPLKQPSPRSRFGAPAPPHPTQGTKGGKKISNLSNDRGAFVLERSVNFQCRHPRHPLSGIQVFCLCSRWLISCQIACKNYYAGFRARATRHFCFGKSAQNHFCPCAALQRMVKKFASKAAGREKGEAYLFVR